jgi:hypothetical protein
MKESEILDLATVYEVTYNRDLSDSARSLWRQVFTDVDRAKAFDALMEIAAREKYPPTPQRIRLRALELDTGFRDFTQVFAELVAAASTCDYFDPNPPAELSAEALTLARILGWMQFRTADLSSTYYMHSIEKRYADVVERAQRRLGQGLPAFVTGVDQVQLGSGIGEIVLGIGEEG